MDPLAQYHFEIAFELEFRKARGDNFQRLFGRIMNMAYLGDFVQTRPWGRQGDNKCDGYLPSQRRFYQCYAPNELEQSATLRKLNEDFLGALPYAGSFFDIWVFTHNAEDGRIPTWLAQERERLAQDHSQVSIELLGFLELRDILFGLADEDLVGLFGPPPTQRAMLSLGNVDLQPILAYLEQQKPPADEDPHPVSPEKLAYNALPRNVEALLKAGMTQATLVETYFTRTVHKERGMQVAANFRDRYRALREQNLDGLDIFDGLRQFALGPFAPSTSAEVSALAVLAYLFQTCEIFESPPEDRA